MSHRNRHSSNRNYGHHSSSHHGHSSNYSSGHSSNYSRNDKSLKICHSHYTHQNCNRPPGTCTFCHCLHKGYYIDLGNKINVKALIFYQKYLLAGSSDGLIRVIIENEQPVPNAKPEYHTYIDLNALGFNKPQVECLCLLENNLFIGFGVDSDLSNIPLAGKICWFIIDPNNVVNVMPKQDFKGLVMQGGAQTIDYAHLKKVNDMKIISGGGTPNLFSAGEEGMVKWWTIGGPNNDEFVQLHVFDIHLMAINELHVFEHRIFTVSNDGGMRMINLGDNNVVTFNPTSAPQAQSNHSQSSSQKPQKWHEKQITSVTSVVQQTPTGPALFVCTSALDRSVKIWQVNIQNDEITLQKTIQLANNPNGSIYRLMTMPHDNRFIVIAGAEGFINIYEDGELRVSMNQSNISSLPLRYTSVVRCVTCDDSNNFYVGTVDGKIVQTKFSSPLPPPGK